MEWLKKNVWTIAAAVGLTAALLAAVWQAGREEAAPAETVQTVLSAEQAFDAALAWHNAKYPELSGCELQTRSTFPAGGNYEVRFSRGGWEFRYEVDAGAGFVRKEETEYVSGTLEPAFLQDLPPEPEPEPEPAPKPDSKPDLPEDRQPALRAALAHAGLEEPEVTDASVQLEYDDGEPMCYKVLFRRGETRYGYEIGLDQAAILAWEKRTDRVAEREPERTLPDVGRDAALAAALGESGVSENQARLVRVKRESEDGRGVYEVSFRVGRKEYEYRIDAATGELIAFEQED